MHEKKQITALQDIFHKLQRESLPVSPSALVESFGMTVPGANETQDVLGFWRLFLGLFLRVPTLSSVYDKVFSMNYWSGSERGGHLVSDRGLFYRSRRSPPEC